VFSSANCRRSGRRRSRASRVGRRQRLEGRYSGAALRTATGTEARAPRLALRRAGELGTAQRASRRCRSSRRRALQPTIGAPRARRLHPNFARCIRPPPPPTAATVPDRLRGLWRRRSIRFADGRHDSSTVVYWLQSESALGDVRIPAAHPRVRDRADLAALSDNELLALTGQGGFAGWTELRGPRQAERTTAMDSKGDPLPVHGMSPCCPGAPGVPSNSQQMQSVRSAVRPETQHAAEPRSARPDGG